MEFPKCWNPHSEPQLLPKLQPSPSVRHKKVDKWDTYGYKPKRFKPKIVALPQTNWCGLQLGKALVHCNHMKVFKTGALFSSEHRNRWRAILPAVVQQMWWQYRDENVLPIHGIQNSTQCVHARCQLQKETDSDNSTSHLLGPS